ncbi:hypothetical protein [Magnetovibrio sp.]|uniref:hypothetical protein n=1 Tax=Magnetovibrio sp. TaxID=2024836 RepID=UPI002F95E87E
MSERGRPGYITLTLEMPIEVAEWLSTNADRLGQAARIAAAKQERASEEHQRQQVERIRQRDTEHERLGRIGYRHHRQAGSGTKIVGNRETTRTIANLLGVDWYLLELVSVRFKRTLHCKVRIRRAREIKRLYDNGQSNQQIAARYRVHPVTVANILRDAKEATFPLAKENSNSQGAVPESAPLAPQVISWEAIKQVGMRA